MWLKGTPVNRGKATVRVKVRLQDREGDPPGRPGPNNPAGMGNAIAARQGRGIPQASGPLEFRRASVRRSGA